MKSYLYFLSRETELHLLLTFRAKNLTHAEKIDIVLEVERQLMSSEHADKCIHLLWKGGFAGDGFTMWSEGVSEEDLSSEAISTLIKNSKLVRTNLPEYLEERMNTEFQFIVFAEESYVDSMLKNENLVHREN